MRKIILFFVCFIATVLNAQVATYSLNGNLNDNLSINNLFYERLGVATTENPVFEASNDGQQVNLNTKYGLKFPKNLIDKIDANSSFEVEFTIKIKTLGLDRGRVHILSNQDNWITFAGFAIFANQPDINQNNFNLTFVHSDGGYHKNVPGHPIFTTTTLGNYNVGEEIKINLIVDLKNKNWLASLNKNKYSGKFNDFYVWEDIKNTIKNNTWYLNWIKDYQQTINTNPNNYTTQINYDEINFYIPRKPTDPAVIRTALQEMTAHVGKTKTLTNDQKEKYTGEIITGFSEVYNELKTEIFNYINTYELNQPILYSNRQQVQTTNLPAESRLLLSLQQYIHDYQFTLENIDNVAGVKFKFAELFPGKVKSTAPRISNGKVSINGKHISIKSVRYAYDNLPAKRPTGYYAAPGEIVTITIPNNLVDKGLKVQIGVHSDDLSNKTNPNRFIRITKEYPLNQTTTKVANPFGGGIYIRVPEPSDLGWFDVTISGAIKSPFFRLIQDHGTTIVEWQKDLTDHNVEWADVESEKYMMTLPWINFKSITNPTSLLAQWNNIMEAYNYAGGFPPEAKIKADYFSVDSTLPGGAFGIGYPQIFGNNQVPYSLNEFNSGYPTYVLNPNFIKPFNYDTAVLFHEIGHSNSFPRVHGDAESIVHLYASYIYNKLYGFSIDEAFKNSAFQQMELNDAAIDWMMSHNFRSNTKMSCDPLLKHLPGGECDEVRYQHRSHAKYSEIAKRFGWEFVHKMNKVFYDKNVALNLNADETKWITADQLVEAASDANNLNMAPLFHFWGYIPSTELAEKLKAKYSPDARFLDMLNHYKTVVPKSATELNTWFTKFKSVVNNERYTTYLSKYDLENYYQQINNQIDYIIYYYNLDVNIIPKKLNFCEGATVATATNTNNLKFYTALTGGSALGATTSLVTSTYFATTTLNGIESTPRVPVAITINAVPSTVASLTTSDADLYKYIGTTNTVKYTATSGASSYIWTVPAGVTIIDGQGTNRLTVDFHTLTASGTGTIGNIGVKAVNALGCASASERTITLSVCQTTTTGSVTQTQCGGSYTWPANGLTYSASTTQTVVTGCNTATLNLTITPLTTTGSVTRTQTGGSYTWPVNIVTYTTSTTQVVISGCNTATLNLTINPPIPASPGTLTTTSGSVPTYHPICRTITVRVQNVSGVSYTFSIKGNAKAKIVSTNGNQATIDVSKLPTALNSSFRIGVVASNATGSSAESLYTIKLGLACNRVNKESAEIKEKVTDEFQVVAYPNPYSAFITIKIQSLTNSKTELFVYDAAGRLMEKMNVRTNEVELGSGYPAGVYNLTIKKGKNVKTVRVVKQ